MIKNKTNRRKQNRRIKKRVSVVKDRQVVRSGLTMIGFMAVFGCIGLVTWVAGMMADPGTLPIKAVKVEGEYRYLSTKTLEKLVAENVNGGFFTLDVEKIRRAVMKAPWVREATVRKLWPDTLYVRIKEQNAVVRWGKDGFLNHKGELFKPEDTTYPKGLITLNGPEGTQRLVFEKYKTLMGLLSTKNQSVAWVKLNDRRSWRFKINDGPTVIVGRKEVDERFWRYVNKVERVLGKSLENIVQVDLRYANGFTVGRDDESKDKSLVRNSHQGLDKVMHHSDLRGT